MGELKEFMEKNNYLYYFGGVIPDWIGFKDEDGRFHYYNGDLTKRGLNKK